MPPKKRLYADEEELYDDDDDEYEDYMRKKKKNLKINKMKTKLTFKQRYSYFLTNLISYCRENKLANDISEDSVVDMVVFSLKEAKYVFVNELKDLEETTFTIMKLGNNRAKLSDDPIKLFNKKLTRNLLSSNDSLCDGNEDYEKYNFIIDINYFLIQTYAKTNRIHGSINFNKDFNTIYVKCNDDDDTVKQSIILITILSILHLLCHLDVQYKNKNKNVLRDENLIRCSQFYRLPEV